MAGTLSTLPVATAAETSASRAARPQQNSPVVATHELTLVTGEVVMLERHANGFQAATVEPAADGAPVTRTVDYVNTSGTDTTLSLRLFGVGETAPPPDGMLTLSANSVTVPANSTASVTVTYHPELGAVGDYTGVITATAPGGTAIRTTVGATKDVPTVDLTVNTIDRNGNPATAELTVFDLDNGVVRQVYPQGGTKTVALPQGRYSVMGIVYTTGKVSGQILSHTLAGEPVVDLTTHQAMVTDARLGTEVKVATPKESEPNGYKLGHRQSLPGKRGIDYMKGASSPLWDHAHVVPTGPVTDGAFEFNFRQRRYSPVIRASYAGQGGALPLEPVIYADRLYGSSKLQAVDAGTGRPQDLAGKDLADKLAVVTRDATSKVVDQIAAVAGAGAKAAVIVNDRPGPYATIVPRATGTAIPAWTLIQDEGAELFGRMADGPTRINLQGIKKDPSVYNIALMAPGGIPADPIDAVTAKNSAVVKSHHRGTEGTLNGKLLTEQTWFSLTTLPVGPAPATYRITNDTEHTTWFPLSTRTSTAWTFKSARPANGKEDLALLWPRYGLDLDAENTAKDGRTHHFDLAFLLQNGTTPDIDGVEVEASADDGATWQPAKVKSKSNGSYKVSVRNPDSGHVSLRVRARDTNGSRIEQTLIKAYAVR
ncbi:PA domain-containing protein [Streptomyces sp. NPDC057496]|uniref:PA domain-containing protein n=1 Tax=Streptomyces sp. NPDC057496 TaxID=3346149 RepID=UPI0036B1570C